MACADTATYTLDGLEEVELRIARDQETIARAVTETVSAKEFVALILAGGYGRGEGGYRHTTTGVRPYNDYDYFVVLRGNRAQIARNRRRLESLGQKLEHQTGVEVDFAILRESKLCRMPFTLMNAELRQGYRVIAGKQDVLESMPRMPVGQVPLAEFTRLLLNRGSLLLMNEQALARRALASEEDREQFRRYIDKSILASGDARLAAASRYDLSWHTKLARLRRLPERGSGRLSERYEQALRTRTGGHVPAFDEKDARLMQDSAVSDWLAALQEVEAARLGSSPDWTEYSTTRVPKGQDGRHKLAWFKNMALTARDFGPMEWVRNYAWSIRYPRERLVSVLPALLSPTLRVPAANINRALSLADHADSPTASASFLKYWARYN